MGFSTTQQLIAKGKAENGYNNSGIESDSAWVDFFNDALYDLVEDLDLTKSLSISFNGTTRENNLPDDFYDMAELYEANGTPVRRRREYGSPQNIYTPGYWIMNQGAKYVLDLFKYTAAQTFTGLYTRYPVALTLEDMATEKPEVPGVGERALIYYAISKALRNNNQLGQAQDYERMYEMERKKIRTASSRARG